MKCLRLVIGIVGLCALACGSKTPAASRIREGSELELTDCTYLRNVNGSASDTDGNAEAHAKSKAREEAAKIGATHLQWIVPCCTYVEAKAYRCDAPDE